MEGCREPGGLTHGACVILISAVSDGFLWQEVVRRGGLDVLSKPLRPDHAANVIKWAMAYWNSGRRAFRK